jgi:hypothetical protein
VIRINKSPTADSRSCDFASVSKDTLLASSKEHIADVRAGLSFFRLLLLVASEGHDYDKLTDIDGFHANFVTGFKERDWLDRHYKLNRHHLQDPAGVPADVNLIDILDMISDCVMAGMARTGEVYGLAIPDEVLRRAFDNTVKLLKDEVVVIDE